MTETDVQTVAEKADLIVNGFAFTKHGDGGIAVLDLRTGKAAILTADREVSGIQAFIAMHYREMYLRWAEFSNQGFYRG